MTIIRDYEKTIVVLDHRTISLSRWLVKFLCGVIVTSCKILYHLK
jgi:hypothetical protein